MNPLLLDIPRELETQRLSIGIYDELDAPQLYAAVVESLSELIPWMPWATPSYAEADALAYCRRTQARFSLRESFGYRLCLKNTGTIVGNCGVERINWNVPKCEIGYWCRTRFAGQGFMTEAASAIVKMVLEKLEMRRVEIRCDPNNTKSRKLAERLGFTLEGILRNESLGVDDKIRDTCVFASIR